MSFKCHRSWLTRPAVIHSTARSRATGVILATLSTAATIAIVACGGDAKGGSTNPGDEYHPASVANCAAGTSIFTTSPIALAEVSGWVPLGNLNPPGHTLPTDHQYLYHTNPDARPLVIRAVPVVSPGNIVIVGARRSVYSSTGNTDYTIGFMPCAQIRGEFAHVATITSELAAKLGAFDQSCDSYSPNPGLTVTQCTTRAVEVKLTAGDAIGTAGGVPGVFGLDFSLWDSRVQPHTFANPTRWIQNPSGFDNFHVVAASDYFAEPTRSQIALKLGAFDGSKQRTASPLGGAFATDIVGTVQGTWFNNTQPTHPETPHLAIGPDNVDPSIIAVSMGMSQPSFFTGQYRMQPGSSGMVNRAPSQITADGNVYCFVAADASVLLMQLVDATTLRVEGRNYVGTCGETPYTFTAGKTFDYKR